MAKSVVGTESAQPRSDDSPRTPRTEPTNDGSSDGVTTGGTAAIVMEEVAFPADIEDIEELRAFLADTDVFGPAAEEGAGYLWHALQRFRITLAITPDVPVGGKVLELGANPYFFTRMLKRRGLDVTCANWFGDGSGIESKGRQVVTGLRGGERHDFEFDHFNIEVDRFPYGDESFSLVFFCEILEHLPMNPVNALVEIHRVLKSRMVCWC